MKIHHNEQDYITLALGNLTNNMTSDQLTQFIIIDKEVKVSEDGINFGMKIILRRMFFYHLTNSYFPTLTLLLIVELTLFFEESHLQVCNFFNFGTILGSYWRPF